jgi:ATP-dependent Zn protease
VLNNEVSFKEVIDADQAKLELQKLVDFIKNPNNYTMLGVMIPGPMDACSLACPDCEYVARHRRGGPAAGVLFFSYAALESVELFLILGVSQPLE